MTISQNLNIVHLDRATIGPSVSLTMPETRIAGQAMTAHLKLKS